MKYAGFQVPAVITMKIIIFWDMPIFRVEDSSVLKKEAAGSLKYQEIATRLVGVTPQKMVIFNRKLPPFKGRENC
jgi:hypothetical protein